MVFSSQKIKALIWKYQIILACASTATATYVIFQDVKAKEILGDMTLSTSVLSDENSILYNFLEHKHLRNEFIEFAKQRSTDV